MDELLFEVAVRCASLTDFVRFGATCKNFSAKTTSQAFWMNLFHFLEPGDPRVVEWASLDWQHWRQACYYLFTRQVLHIREWDLVSQEITLENAPDKTEFEAKLKTFMANDKIPRLAKGLKVGFIEKGTFYVVPQPWMENDDGDHGEWKEYYEREPFVKKQPFVFDRISPHYYSEYHEDGGVRVNGQLIYRTWSNTWDVFLHMVEPALKLPADDFQNLSYIGHLLNSTVNSVPYYQSSSIMFNGGNHSAKDYDLNREDCPDKVPQLEHQFISTPCRHVLTKVPEEQQEGLVCSVRAPATCEPSVEYPPVCYYTCTTCDHKLYVCTDCVHKIAKLDLVDHNSNTDTGVLLPNDVQEYYTDYELGRGRGGLFLSKKFTSDILSVIGLLDAPVTNRTKTQWSHDPYSPCNDPLGYIVSQYSIVPRQYNHKGLRLERWLPHCDEDRLDSRPLVHPIVEENKPHSDFFEIPYDGNDYKFAEDGIMPFFTPDNGHADGDGSSDRACPVAWRDHYKLDGTEPKRFCYRSIVPDRDIREEFGDVLLPLQQELEEKRVDHYMEKLKRFHENGQPEKVVGTVLALGYPTNNDTFRFMFVIDGHHKLAAVSQWNALHPDHPMKLNVILYSGETQRAPFNRKHTMEPSENEEPMEILSVLSDLEDETGIELPGRPFVRRQHVNNLRKEKNIQSMGDFYNMTKAQLERTWPSAFVPTTMLDAFYAKLQEMKAKSEQLTQDTAYVDDPKYDGLYHAFHCPDCSHIF